MKVDYLSFDSLQGGVGASQVVPYVTRLAAAGVQLTVHSFEAELPDPDVRRQLEAARVTWHPHAFGSTGARGGASRVARAAALVRGASLVHARSDMAAAAALLARPRSWVWDMRSFWREQRMELGMLVEGSLQERAFRLVERRAAAGADAIITLAAAAVPVIAGRHGEAARGKSIVIPTCVDLERFQPSALPAGPIRFLLAGTLNTYYDVPSMMRLVQRSRRHADVRLRVLSPDAARWTRELRSAEAQVSSARPAQMPAHVRASSVGLSVCRRDLGPSLTAAMPTKIAEFLASGRPVVVSPGIGDLDELLRRHDCGVILPSDSDDDLDESIERLGQLLRDPELPGRCRRLAEEHFDVDRAVIQMIQLYQQVG